jgi:RNA polymerase sigma-70 factor (ECF subfamily)
MVGSTEDAEDLAQATFVRLHRHLKRLQPQAKFSTVLFGIARNLTLNHLRDTKRRGRGKTQSIDAQVSDTQELAAAESGRPDQKARLHEIERTLEEGIALLSRDHREVLVLRELQGMDYDSMAVILRCRKGTIKSRLARAREQLRQRLIELGGDLL